MRWRAPIVTRSTSASRSWRKGAAAGASCLAEALPGASHGGFGWELGEDGARRLLFEATPELEASLAALLLENQTRRAGRAVREGAGEIRAGASLPALAWKRTGGFLWIAA